MHRGIALDDSDRAPWLGAHSRVDSWRMLSEGRNGVVACSALKQSYRDELVVDPNSVKVVYLKGSKEVIAERLRDRTGHFMNPDPLQSQIDTLEEPRDAIVVDVSAAPEAIVNAIRARLGALAAAIYSVMTWGRLADARREFLERLAAGLRDQEPYTITTPISGPTAKSDAALPRPPSGADSNPITTGDSIQQICPITWTHRLYPVARIAVGNNSVESAEVAVRAA